MVAMRLVNPAAVSPGEALPRQLKNTSADFNAFGGAETVDISR